MSVLEQLDAAALVTLPEARRFVWRHETDASRDGILVDAVNQVSAAITSYCQREFTDTTADPGPDVRAFQIESGGFVNLAPYDLRASSEVIKYSDRDASVQQVLTSDQYRLGRSKLSPTYLWLQVGEPSVSELETGFGWQLSVEGEWGMEIVPQDVKLAALQWVSNIVKNPGSFASEAMSGYVVTADVDFSPSRAGMPTAVRHRLAPWRRGGLVL